MITTQLKKSLRDESVKNIQTFLGVVESPPWSNRGALIDKANTFVGNSPHDAPPYCCALCCLNADHAAQTVGIKFTDLSIAKTGYCPDMYNHAKSHGTAIDAQLVVQGLAFVLPGDLMLEWIPSLGGYHHAETVVVPPSKGSGTFITVGGNTVPDDFHSPPGHDGQGYGVFRRHRNATDKAPGGHNLYCFVSLI